MQVFQGISQSKKKAKVMAAEYALMHLGEIDALTDQPPSPSFIPRPSTADDYSSDIVLPSMVKSTLLYDFSKQEVKGQDFDLGDETEPAKKIF